MTFKRLSVYQHVDEKPPTAKDLAAGRVHGGSNPPIVVAKFVNVNVVSEGQFVRAFVKDSYVAGLAVYGDDLIDLTEEALVIGRECGLIKFPCHDGERSGYWRLAN